LQQERRLGLGHPSRSPLKAGIATLHFNCLQCLDGTKTRFGMAGKLGVRRMVTSAVSRTLL